MNFKKQAFNLVAAGVLALSITIPVFADNTDTTKDVVLGAKGVDCKITLADKATANLGGWAWDGLGNYVAGDDAARGGTLINYSVVVRKNPQVDCAYQVELKGRSMYGENRTEIKGSAILWDTKPLDSVQPVHVNAKQFEANGTVSASAAGISEQNIQPGEYKGTLNFTVATEDVKAP